MNKRVGFFSDIRSFFHAKYGGRHLAIALKSLARHDMKSFRRILAFAADEKTLSPKYRRKIVSASRHPDSISAVEIEYLYGTNKRAKNELKRADLVVLEDDEPTALFEIKDEDQKASGNSKQLARYVKWCQSKNVPLIHISRYPLEGRDRKFLLRHATVVASLSYGDIHKALEKAGDAPLAQMIREYLEDLGAMRYRQMDFRKGRPDHAPLKFWARRFLDVTLVNGGKNRTDQSIESFPAHIECLFGNLEFFGSRIREANPRIIRQRFSREFKRELDLYDPTKTDLKNLAKWVKAVAEKSEALTTVSTDEPEYNGLVNSLAHTLRHGPERRYLSFEGFARLHPPKSKPLRFQESVFVWLEYYVLKKGKGDVEIGLDVGIQCRKFNIEEEVNIHRGGAFPTERVVWNDIVKALKKAKSDALDEMPFSPQKRALKNLSFD